jgi:hypothetical protein
MFPFYLFLAHESIIDKGYLFEGFPADIVRHQVKLYKSPISTEMCHISSV